MFWKIFGQKPYNNDLEPSEIMLDALSSQHEVEMGRFEIPLSELSLKIFLGFFSMVFLVFFLRASQFQVIENQKYQILSDKNQYTFKQGQFLRGVMYDRNGKQLIHNISKFHLVCKKQSFKEDILPVVANLINRKVEELKSELREKDNDIFVARNLNQEQVVSLHIRLADMPDCEIKSEVSRQYDDGVYFSHLIGYKREDGKGEGIEQYYDEYLKPKQSHVKVKKNVKGEEQKQNENQFSEPGNSLVLTINSDLQKVIVEKLRVCLQNSGAVTAAAVALDPRTGEVLALVSLPEYDNNLFASGFTKEQWDKLINNKYSPLLNRAIAGQYPSGSTIKPFVALAALENGIIEEHTPIYSPDRICISSRYSDQQTCFVDWKTHGTADVKRAIAESVNPFFYIVSGGYGDIKGMGIDKMAEFFSRYNFGQKTGIDLPGEVAGNLPSPEWKIKKVGTRWTLGDTYNMAIGQGFLQVTPIQMATAIASIANGGTYYKPYVVKEIVDAQKKSIFGFESVIIKEGMASDNSVRIVREGMRQTVESDHGTAHLLSYLPKTAAAKTGTAQVPRKGRYDTWIEIFAPYDNPEIVLVILAEEVPTERFFVLQASYEILRWYFTPPEKKVEAVTSTIPTTTNLQNVYQEVNELIQQTSTSTQN